jgi:hypothetical protein
MNNPGLITHAQGSSATFFLATKLTVGSVLQKTFDFVTHQLEQGLGISEMSTVTNCPSCVNPLNNLKFRHSIFREFWAQLQPDFYSLQN